MLREVGFGCDFCLVSSKRMKDSGDTEVAQGGMCNMENPTCLFLGKYEVFASFGRNI